MYIKEVEERRANGDDHELTFVSKALLNNFFIFQIYWGLDFELRHGLKATCIVDY